MLQFIIESLSLLAWLRLLRLRIHGTCFFVLHKKFDQWSHRPYLLLLHKSELHDKKDESLEACVKMWLRTKRHKLVKVVVIYVRVRTEQAFEQQLHQRVKI